MNDLTPLPSCQLRPPRCERVLISVGAALVVGSALLWSSPEYRERHLLAACIVAAFYARRLLGPLLSGMGRRGWIFIGGLFLVHGASWLGGVGHGESVAMATERGGAGLLGVLGLAVFSAVLLGQRWRRFAKWTALGVLGLLLAGSYVGFFLGIERFTSLGKYTFQFGQMRMALIWPTRLLTSRLGQIAWEHTNYAAYYFALALALIMEYLGGGGKGRVWWWLGTLLGGAVFLTASRNGWLMLAIGVTVVMIGRGPRFALKALAMFALAILLGFACLKVKLAVYPPTPESVVVMATHGSELMERGSAGRLNVYPMIWDELDGARLCGLGLWATGRPVGQLEHEHSVFMATLRGGGVVGLAGHLLVIVSAASAALGLARGGRRWPAVLFATAVGGLLFERSTVIGLSGNCEFIAHWVAVLLPMILMATEAVRDRESENREGTI